MGWFDNGSCSLLLPLCTSSLFPHHRCNDNLVCNTLPHIISPTNAYGITDSDQAQNYQNFTQSDPDNQPKFSHELAAGAASYFAAREYEKHCAENGMISLFAPDFQPLS